MQQIAVYLICGDPNCADSASNRDAVLDAVKAAISQLAGLDGRIDYYTASTASEVAKTAKVTSTPTVLIIDPDTNMLIHKLPGVNKPQITKLLVEMGGGIDLGSGGNDGVIPSDTDPGGPQFNPFGLFDLNINPPGWMWLAIAGIALYKASSSKNPAGMYGWGAAGLVAGMNYWNKRNKSISGFEIPEMVGPAFNRDATGDVVAGDVIEFKEAVFEGSFKKPRYVGDRTIQARVLKESYGADKQQHTFTLEILSSTGANANEYKPGQTTRRKGRNIYKNGTYRQSWADESLRESVANEKHDRGGRARTVRDQRKGSIPGWG
ncbi:MAG: hypothetical protein K9I85_05995 [Saprospiraceae bacterium]|nr:hypothetical protein [Saprospiraceae bacterium]